MRRLFSISLYQEMIQSISMNMSMNRSGRISINDHVKVNTQDAMKVINIKSFYDSPVSISIKQKNYTACLKQYEPKLRGGAKVLKIGTERGYLETLMAYMIQNNHMVGEYDNKGMIYVINDDHIYNDMTKKNIDIFKFGDMVNIKYINSIHNIYETMNIIDKYNTKFDIIHIGIPNYESINSDLISKYLVDHGILMKLNVPDEKSNKHNMIIKTKCGDEFNTKYVEIIS